MIEFPREFKEFLQLLNSKKIEYLVIGGYAVGYHGYPRATGDMDVWIAINEKNALKMVDVLKEDDISVTQSEGMFFDRETIRKLFTFNRNIFPILCYYFTMVPTYPSGTIGFSFCSKKYHPIKDIYTKKGISMKNIHSSWSDLRKQLKGQDRITVSMNCQNGETVHIRKSTRPEPRQQVIYDALGLAHYPGRTIKKVVSV